MRPLGSYPKPSGRSREAGFSLIEVLIALAILAAMAALAGTPLARMYDRVSFAMARGDVERELASLPERARIKGKNLELASFPKKDGDDPLIALPEGWSLVADPAIQYRYDGVCLGGKVTIKSDYTNINYMLVPPFCRPQEQP